MALEYLAVDDHSERAATSPRLSWAGRQGRQILRSYRQCHLFPDRPQGRKPGDDVEGLRPPYASDQPGHGAVYFCDPFVSGSFAAQPVGLLGDEAFQAFTTAVSIITNTNWRSYGGESPLSTFRQMGAITAISFASAPLPPTTRSLPAGVFKPQPPGSPFAG